MQSNLQIRGFSKKKKKNTNSWVHMALLKSKLTSEISITQTNSQLTTIIKLKLKYKLKPNKS